MIPTKFSYANFIKTDKRRRKIENDPIKRPGNDSGTLSFSYSPTCPHV